MRLEIIWLLQNFKSTIVSRLSVFVSISVPAISLAIESKYRYVFSFILVEVNETNIEKETLNLIGNKASQNSDMPTKVIKEKLDIFSNFLCISFSCLKNDQEEKL